ncbi:MAG: hypothetical protein ISS48_04660 [Candidatus Aenigmarchaeota archaeon]|nr:hypothetical protein [Candidatus Aenigmarchaeota archaeon]
MIHRDRVLELLGEEPVRTWDNYHAPEMDYSECGDLTDFWKEFIPILWLWSIFLIKEIKFKGFFLIEWLI